MKTETMINDLKGNLTEEEMASVLGGSICLASYTDIDPVLEVSIEDEETPL